LQARHCLIFRNHKSKQQTPGGRQRVTEYRHVRAVSKFDHALTSAS